MERQAVGGDDDDDASAAAAARREDYKAEHESFVSGHAGSTPLEIMLLSLVVPVSILLLALMRKVRSTTTSSSWGFGVENAVIALPLLFAVTCCSECHAYMTASLAAVAFLVFTALYGQSKTTTSRPSNRAGPSLADMNIAAPRRLPFVTNYRAGMLLTTAVCILAVDFPVYPRRLAKTETFGFGLMDIGVGSFVFAAGLVSQEARKGSSASGGRSALGCLSKSWVECGPILALGLARLLSVKASGYHEHVSEYGLHWNFFFSLTASKLAASALLVALPVGWCWALSPLLGICHELALSTALAEWALNDELPRSGGNLVEANREGVVSVPGYVAIYLSGVNWGHYFANAGTSFRAHAHIAKDLFVWSTLMWSSLFYTSTDVLFQPASRRLANWAYFNWMVAYNLTLLLLFLVVDDLCIVWVGEWMSHAQQNSGSSGRGGTSSRNRRSALRQVRPPPPPVGARELDSRSASAIPHARLRLPQGRNSVLLQRNNNV